jgi:hypothetical protein
MRKKIHYTPRPSPLDSEAGALPDIRRDIDGLVYFMTPPGVPRGSQLFIRYADDGDISAAILIDPAAQ